MCRTRDLNGKAKPPQVPPGTRLSDLKPKVFLDVALDFLTAPESTSFWWTLEHLKEVFLLLSIQRRFGLIELALVENGRFAFRVIGADQSTDGGS